MANIGPDNFELVKELLGDKNTMNRSTLEEVLFEELGFSREMSRVFVTQFFQTISDVLATGEEVKLTTLGRFEICGRAYKMFFDPEAKEWFDAPTRLDVYFHPSKKLTLSITTSAKRLDSGCLERKSFLNCRRYLRKGIFRFGKRAHFVV